MPMSKEEKALRASVERGEWKRAGSARGDVKRFAGYARHAFRKDRRINIRLSTQDLAELQKRSVEEGLPYQTLIASVLHKFASGRLVESGGRGR